MNIRYASPKSLKHNKEARYKSKRAPAARLCGTDHLTLKRQVKKGVDIMTESKRELIERLSKKFASLPDPDKKFIAGYMAGREEERAKWEQKEQIGASA